MDAKIFATVLLPIPSGPENIYACPILLLSINLFKLSTTLFWPIIELKSTLHPCHSKNIKPVSTTINYNEASDTRLK